MSNYTYTCACCGTSWDRTSTGRKPTKAELARMVCQSCIMAPKRIAALEAENAELKIERDKYVGATQCATRSAERRWRKLQGIMQILETQGDPEVEVAAVMTDLERAKNERDRLRDENAALREDKARLVEALERICTHSRDADCGDHCSNACMYCQGREAIDAARKGEKG